MLRRGSFAADAVSSGLPRTLAEVELAVTIDPCEVCGDRRFGDVSVTRVGDRWLARVACRRCTTRRERELPAAGELPARGPSALELGGDRPSAILTPRMLLGEIDRLVPSLLATDAPKIERVQTLLIELAKFIPDGGHQVDPRDDDDASLADRVARPDRYALTWIAAQLEHWAAIAGSLEPAADVVSRGRLDPSSLAAHRGWLAAAHGVVGASGRRLDVIGADAGGSMLVAADLSGGRLERVSLRRANLRGATLDRIELVRSDVDHAQLVQASFEAALVVDCSFTRASAERSRWARALVKTSSFRNAVLIGSRLDGVRFIRCDLRSAFLRNTSAIGAVFTSCDLRGVDLEGCDLSSARLVECQVAGARGLPVRSDGWSVERANFSHCDDASDLGDGDDLLDELGSS